MYPAARGSLFANGFLGTSTAWHVASGPPRRSQPGAVDTRRYTLRFKITYAGSGVVYS